MKRVKTKEKENYSTGKTIKQARFLKIYKDSLENIMDGKITKGDIMLKAGYSKTVSKQPCQVMNSKAIRPELQVIVEQYEDKRRMILEALTKEKITGESGRNLAVMADKFQKNISLLVGDSTSNVAVKTITIPLDMVK
jgi:hypothetical protein